jgi:hypothetical protein
VTADSFSSGIVKYLKSMLASSLNSNGGITNSPDSVSFEVLTVVKMSVLVFCVVMLCGLVDRYKPEDQH